MEEVKIKEHSWRKAEIGTQDGEADPGFVTGFDPFTDYELPADKAQKKNSLMLDLATANGRWLIAGTKKKYIPIGLDVSIEQAKVAISNLRRQKINGYVVVGEMEELPFQENLFDLVWSSKVFQPANGQSLQSYTEQLNGILAKSGKLKLPFQIQKFKNGRQFERLEGRTQINHTQTGEFSISAYENIFKKNFSNVKSLMHSCFGTTMLKEHFTIARAESKLFAPFSHMIAFLSRFISPLKKFSDAIYIKGQKSRGPQNLRIGLFLKHHWLRQNLNVVYLLQCPISGGPVYLSKDSLFVISDKAGVKYPVIDEIPVMLKRVAVPIEKKAVSGSI